MSAGKDNKPNFQRNLKKYRDNFPDMSKPKDDFGLKGIKIDGKFIQITEGKMITSEEVVPRDKIATEQFVDNEDKTKNKDNNDNGRKTRRRNNRVPIRGAKS